MGKGASELTAHPDQFTVNGVEAGKAVTAKKASEKSETVMKLAVLHGIENPPVGLESAKAKEYADRHARRMKIIGERFKGVDPEAFMTLPTALHNQMTGDTAKVAAISKQKVRIGGIETEIVMVPSGNDIGFTTKAAQKLQIPNGVTELRLRVERGVLVID